MRHQGSGLSSGKTRGCRSGQETQLCLRQVTLGAYWMHVEISGRQLDAGVEGRSWAGGLNSRDGMV